MRERAERTVPRSLRGLREDIAGRPGSALFVSQALVARFAAADYPTARHFARPPDAIVALDAGLSLWPAFSTRPL